MKESTRRAKEEKKNRLVDIPTYWNYLEMN